jgi:hypothetical protein
MNICECGHVHYQTVAGEYVRYCSYHDDGCDCTGYRPKAEPPVAICPHCQTRWTWCDDNWFAVIKRLGGHCQCPDNWKCTLCNKPIQNPVDFAEYEKNGAHVKCAEQELTGHTQADPLIATEAEARAEDEIECELCGHTQERHCDYVCRACACTDFRPKAAPPDNATTHNSARYGETVGNCEPKAPLSLEDAFVEFLRVNGVKSGDEKAMALVAVEFARQQRRDAVAEFVRKFDEQLEDGLLYTPRQVMRQIEAVAEQLREGTK